MAQPTTATISGQFVRPNLGGAPVVATIEAVADGGRLKYDGMVIVGKFTVQIDKSSGTATATIPILPQTGLTPDDARWQLNLQVGSDTYKAQFTLDGDTTWDALVDVSDVPITGSLLAQAQAAASDASASATAAAASAAAAEAVGATNDAIMAGVVEDTGSDTRAALLSSFADLDSLPEVLAIKNGVKADTTTGLDGTDDTDALNALITSVNSFGGGRIKLPEGKIRLDTPIVPKNGVMIQGAGKERTRLYSKQEAFRFEGGSTSSPLTDFHVRDLSIDGTNQTSTYKGYHGQYNLRCSWVNLYITNTQQTGLGPDFLRQCLIENVTTENTGLGNDGTQPSGNGIGIGCGGWTDLEGFLITGCTAINAKRFGIMAEGGSSVTGAKIIGNTATTCGDAGFGLGAGLGMIVEGNTAYANTGNGFEFSNLTLTANNPAGQAICRGNVSRKNGGHGIAYDATVHYAAQGHSSISDNLCAENTGDGINVNVDLSLPVSVTQVTGNRITGNICYGNGQAGITVATTGTSGSGYVLTGWKIDDNILSLNGLVTGQYHIRVAANMLGCSFSRNTFYHNTVSTLLAGIRVGYGAAAITLTACRIDDNTYANTGNSVLSVDAAATMTACTTSNNQPDAGNPAPRTVTASTTLTASDSTVLANGSSLTINLPAAASASPGREYTVKNLNASVVQVRVVSGTNTNIDNTAVDRLGQYASATYVTDGTQWWKKGAVTTNQATLDFPSIAAGAIATLTVSVPGAQAGQPVALGPPAAIEAGLMWSGFVSAASTVTVRLHNTTASAMDPASATWDVRVLR